MKRKKVIAELQQAKNIRAQCPHCDGEFWISKATIFDALGELPPTAQQFKDEKEKSFQERAAEIQERIAALKGRVYSANVRSEHSAMSVNLGFILEKLALGFANFPHNPEDCRALYEPIDYIAFDGLTQANALESIAFMDVKTGKATLNGRQKMIKRAIEEGKVDYKEV